MFQDDLELATLKNVQDQGANVKIGEESRQQAWDIGIYLGINGKVHPKPNKTGVEWGEERKGGEEVM